MTNREKAIVMAFTGVCMLTGDNLKHYYDYCSELYGHSVFTHEFYTEDIQKLSKPDFIKLCAETTDEGAVKHGKLLICSDGYELICNECDSKLNTNQIYNYCPICGMKVESRIKWN